MVSFDELAIRWSPFFRDCIINELIVEKSYLLLIFITYGKKSLKIPKRHTSKDNQNDGQKKKPKRKLLIHKTLHRPDWATRIPLKYEGELRYSGGISKYCSTSGIHHVSYSCYKPGDTSRMRKGLVCDHDNEISIFERNIKVYRNIFFWLTFS